MKRKRKRQISKVQQANDKQFSITIPIEVAYNWLCVERGDKVEYKIEKGVITLSKVI